MKDLLLKIQAELRQIDGPRESDVYLSVDPSIIPDSAKFPCIGIKDGTVGYIELMADAEEADMKVTIHVYDKLIKGDDAVLKLLDLAEAIHSKLKDNLLGDYVMSVQSKSEDAITPLYRKGMDNIILRKTLSYQYERES